MAEALTWIWVRPGENRGCVGCHESRTEVPDFDFMPEALRKPPTRMGILAKDRLALDFRKDLMPIIESKCVSCHNETKRAGSLDLSGGLELVFHYYGVDGWSYQGYNGAFFNRAYESLLAAGRIPEPEYGNVRQFQQGAYVAPGYAARSPLVWRLTGSRYCGKTFLPKDKVRTCPPVGNPQLTEEEKYRFIQWVDLGAQFSNIIGMGELPGWQAPRAQAITQAHYDKLSRPIARQHLARDVSERCMLCHRQKVKDIDPEWKSSLLWKTPTDGLAAWTPLVEKMRGKKVGRHGLVQRALRQGRHERWRDDQAGGGPGRSRVPRRGQAKAGRSAAEAGRAPFGRVAERTGRASVDQHQGAEHGHVRPGAEWRGGVEPRSPLRLCRRTGGGRTLEARSEHLPLREQGPAGRRPPRFRLPPN
jgi:hypothetical protein